MSGIPIRRKPITPFITKPGVKGYIRQGKDSCQRLTASGWLNINTDLFFFLKEHGHEEIDRYEAPSVDRK